MLLPIEVRPFLLHEDTKIREHALRYFAEAHDPSPVTADDIWEVADRYPDASGRRFRAFLHQLPLTETSAERLLRALHGGDSEQRVHLEWALLAAPIEVVRRASGDATVFARLSGETQNSLRDRVSLDEMTFDGLWKALGDEAVAHSDTYTYEAESRRRTERIVRALARFPAEAVARGLEVLRRPPSEDAAQEWMQLYALRLFGHVRDPEALTPLLARVIDEEGDFADDYAAAALVHLGTAEVVDAVEKLFASVAGTRELITPDVLGRIKRPESEEALIRLLTAVEDDDAERTNLAMQLCDLCTTSRDALGIIEEIVEDEAYDPMLATLDELVLTTGGMVGWSPRNAGEWRARIAEREASRAARSQAYKGRMEQRQSGAPGQPKPTAPPRAFVPYGKKAKKKR